MFYVRALVTFSSNGERNRARNAIQAWVADWNSANPGDPLTGTVTDTSYLYPPDDEAHANVNARALLANYTANTYAPILQVHLAIQTDVNANAYWDIIGLSSGMV